ncbi:MAG: diacylglycerol kinase family protein [Pseudomonadota bacterium]
MITNPHSGSTDPAKAAAVERLFAERGLTLAGRTDFPDDALPTPKALDRAKVDTAVLFAGDGTINAAICALAEWQGAVLILPGGTMNMLAKTLHGNADPTAIVAAAHTDHRRVGLPFVESGKNRAFVGLIVGPAASWFRAREMVRSGRLSRLLPAIRMAWRRTFGRGIRLAGAPGFPPQVQGAFVHAVDDHLQVAAVDARDFRSIADLGWSWIAGDWVAAHAVTERRATTLSVAERRSVLALFDGEPVSLEPGAVMTAGRSRAQFIATIGEAA